MSLARRELAYLERRERLLARWPWAGGLMAAVIVLAMALCAWASPLLINPWAVIARLEAGTLGTTMLMTMAAMLPVVVLTLSLLLLIGVLLAFVAFANERRLLRMVRRLQGSATKKK